MQASLIANAFSPPAGLDRQGMAQRSSDVPAGAVDSNALLQGQKAVAIVHNGVVYRLQATKLGKLILTK